MSEEMCFRRGFHHGVNAALDALEAGATTEDVCRWMDEEVAEWRNGHREDLFVPNPANAVGMFKPRIVND